MEQPAPQSPGLLASVRRMIDSGLALVHNRLELFAVEFQEEKWRAVDLLLTAGVALLLALLALLSASALIVVALWEWSPVAALAGLTVLYGAGSAWAMLRIRRQLNSGAQPFAGTLAEFRRDRECLRRDN